MITYPEALNSCHITIARVFTHSPVWAKIQIHKRINSFGLGSGPDSHNMYLLMQQFIHVVRETHDTDV